MIDRMRVLVVLTRLPVVLLLGLFTATGLAHAGAGDHPVLLVKALVVVVAFLLFSVVVNDVADEAIDRLNLPDAGRPLVTGTRERADMARIAVASAITAVGASLLLGPVAVAVTAAGLALSLAYSVRPVRLADRGALASLLLPAGYVAVPYLLGVLAVRPAVRAADLVLLAGLYVGFVGRIVLKDFRDVRGDALFGKRTFLVRHGRRRTCAVSAGCWVLGAATLAGVRGADVSLVVAYTAYVAAALLLLRALATDGGARRDEALVSAVAIIGRGMILSVVAHLAMLDARWTALRSAAVLAALTTVFIGQAVTVVRHGPRSRLTVPAGWASASRAEV